MPPRRPYGPQETGHARTTATRTPEDRPRPHDGHTGPRGPSTPPRRPHKALRTGYTSTPATQTTGERPRHHGAHAGPRGPATRTTGDRPRPHAGHTGPSEQATTPQWPHAALGSDHATQRPHGTQGFNHAPSVATWGPEKQATPHGSHTDPEDRPRPHGGHTWSSIPCTQPRRPHGAQRTCHISTWPHRPQVNGHANSVATQGQGDRPRLHGGHTGPRGPATSPRRPYGA